MAGVKGRSGGGGKKSIEELKLLGTYRKDRHGDVLAPENKRILVKPQDHITSGNVKIDRLAIFNWFAKILHEQGMTQEVDSVLLSQLVEAHATYITAINYARADPEAILGRKLASAVAMEAGREVRTLLNEFRLTPSSRTIKLDNGKEVPDDPVSAFLNAKVISED